MTKNYFSTFTAKWSRWFIWLSCCLIFSGSAMALEVPSLSGRIVDQSQSLTREQQQQLEQQLQQLEQNSKDNAQVAVLLINSLAGESIEDYAVQVFDKWQLGRKDIDNGVLLLIAMQDRQMRIEVGYGLEGNITDLQSKHIINAMGKLFRQGDIYGGINLAIARLSDLIEQPPRSDDAQQDQDSETSSDIISLLILIVIVLTMVLRSIKFVGYVLLTSGISYSLLYGLGGSGHSSSLLIGIVAVSMVSYFMLFGVPKADFSSGGKGGSGRGGRGGGGRSGGGRSSGGRSGGGGGRSGGGGASGRW